MEDGILACGVTVQMADTAEYWLVHYSKELMELIVEVLWEKITM